MSKGSPKQASQERRSVLGELPRTRPQRASRRRETARALASAPTAASASPTAAPPAASAPKTTSKKSSASKSRPASRNGSRSKRQTVASPPPQATPRQGYEAEPELVGTPVTPPSSTELVGAVAELAGELVQTGVAAGGRLLKGALSRLTGA